MYHIIDEPISDDDGYCTCGRYVVVSADGIVDRDGDSQCE